MKWKWGQLLASLFPRWHISGDLSSAGPKEVTSVAYWQPGKTKLKPHPWNQSVRNGSDGINELIDRQLMFLRWRILNRFGTLSTNNSFGLTCRVRLSRGSASLSFIQYIHIYIYMCAVWAKNIKPNQDKFPRERGGQMTGIQSRQASENFGPAIRAKCGCPPN